MAINLYEVYGDAMRFSIEFNGKKRKIFRLFNASTDGSLGFLSYLESTHLGEMDIPGEPTTGKTFKISDIKPIEFKIHKANFHKSGVVTSKDKEGKRAFDDFTSIKFDEIKDSANLFVMQLTYLEKYPEIKDNKSYIDLINGNIEILPPNIQVVLAKKDHNVSKYLNNKIENNLFMNKDIFSQFGLDLYVNIRRHSTGKYAPEQAVFIITY